MSGSGLSACWRCIAAAVRPMRCAAYREVRTVLVGQLGIEPGPELRQLEARILRQDSRLEYRAISSAQSATTSADR